MTQISTDKVTVLLVCPPGLEQKSLYTTINAVPGSTVIARVAELKDAQKIAQMRKPDILVVDAKSLTVDARSLLMRSKKLNTNTTHIVLVSTSKQKLQWTKDRADYVLEYNRLNLEFPQIVRRVQGEIQARLSSSSK